MQRRVYQWVESLSSGRRNISDEDHSGYLTIYRMADDDGWVNVPVQEDR
jgi:hypothetical protein